MWQILVYEDSGEKRLTDLGTIQKEACVVIANGLTVLYPTTEDKHTLMMQLLNNGNILTPCILGNFSCFFVVC